MPMRRRRRRSVQRCCELAALNFRVWEVCTSGDDSRLYRCIQSSPMQALGRRGVCYIGWDGWFPVRSGHFDRAT